LNMGKNQQQEGPNVIVQTLNAKEMPNTWFSYTSKCLGSTLQHIHQVHVHGV
jgi:hypothetical protein